MSTAKQVITTFPLGNYVHTDKCRAHISVDKIQVDQAQVPKYHSSVYFNLIHPRSTPLLGH